MYTKTTLAVAALGALFLATPQAATAAPNPPGVKEMNQSNVEPVRHRKWRHRHYRRHGYYGHRHHHHRRYYRRPGFGIYLGF
jgi:hypothetical protein